MKSCLPFLVMVISISAFGSLGEKSTVECKLTRAVDFEGSFPLPRVELKDVSQVPHTIELSGDGQEVKLTVYISPAPLSGEENVQILQMSKKSGEFSSVSKKLKSGESVALEIFLPYKPNARISYYTNCIKK